MTAYAAVAFCASVFVAAAFFIFCILVLNGGRTGMMRPDWDIQSPARRPRALRAAGRAAGCAAVAIVFACIAQGAVFELSGGRHYILAMPVAVSSGSMSRAGENCVVDEGRTEGFSAGDLIFIEKAEEDELAEGDIVMYRAPGGAVVHRIVGVFTAGGQTRYVTRGDANPAPDAVTVAFSQIIGRYTGVKIPAAGAVSLYLRSTFGMCSLLVAAYVCIAGRIVFAGAFDCARLPRPKPRSGGGQNNFL